MKKMKEAYAVRVFLCDHCSCVHIELGDDQARPFASAVLSPETVQSIQDAQDEQDEMDRRERSPIGH
jgi:hypothetical protein